MGIYLRENFKFLNPLTGEVPYWPFNEAPNLTSRARRILGRHRTEEDVVLMSEDIEDNFEFFFDAEEQIAKTNGTYQDEDYPTSENTSALDALINIFDTTGFAMPKDTEAAPEYEYFAVLALALIAKYVRDFGFSYDHEAKDYIPREPKDIQPYEIVRMANDLIHATEAVCRAEALQMADMDEKRREFMQKRHKEDRHAELQNNRHKKTNEAKALVIAEFGKDPKKFDSATDHATAILEILRQNAKFEYKHSTVTTWVRERARDLKIRFR